MRLFSRLLLASTVFNVLAILLFASRFRADAIANGTAKAGWLVAILLEIGINTLFWWRISIRAGNFARWLYIALLFAGLFQIPRVYSLSHRYGPVYGILMAASMILGLGTIIVLLRKDVSQWLRSGGKTPEVDPSVFD